MNYNTKEYPLIEAFIEEVLDKVENGFNTTIVTLNDYAEPIIKALCTDDMTFSHIDYNDEDCDEYVISVVQGKYGTELYVEPAYSEATDEYEEGYLEIDSDICYVDSEMSDDVFDSINARVVVFSIQD